MLPRGNNNRCQLDFYYSTLLLFSEPVPAAAQDVQLDFYYSTLLLFSEPIPAAAQDVSWPSITAHYYSFLNPFLLQHKTALHPLHLGLLFAFPQTGALVAQMHATACWRFSTGP